MLCAWGQVDLHGMHVEEALTVLDRHLVNLGGLGSPSGILLQVRRTQGCTHAHTHARMHARGCMAMPQASAAGP